MDPQFIAELQEYLGSQAGQAALRKSGGISQSTGLVFYDLQAPSEKAVPMITPMRLKIPRRPGRGDTAHRWKAIFGLDTATFPSVGEGNRGAAITTTVVPMSAAYAGLGVENPATWEAAQYAAQNFEDVRATAMSLGVYDLQQKEEWQIIGGMQTGKLGRGAQPTVVGSNAGSILDGTYLVTIVPLNLWAYKQTTVSATGVVQQVANRTNADGTNDTYNAGPGRPSATGTSGALSTTNTNDLTITWASTPGATAYAVYVGTSGNQLLQAITTAPTLHLKTLVTGTQNVTALTDSDYSYNDETTHGSTVLEYDGLLSYLTGYASNGMYYKDALGGSLASDGQGGVDYITNAFTSFFENYKLGPTDIWCGVAQGQQIRNLVIQNGSTPIVRVNTDGSGPVIAGGFEIPTLTNIYPTTEKNVMVHVHPDIPNGMILFTADRLPYQIQQLEAGPWCIRERQPFYGLEWPMTTRKHQMGVYVDANLELHTPFAFGAIQGLV